MNKYLRGLIVIPTGFIKTLTSKIFHIKGFKGVQLAQISPFSEITLNYGGVLHIGKNFKLRDGTKIRVRKNAKCIIGKDVSIGSNSIVTCRNFIEIGDGTEIAPNVMIYDHDHDFRTYGGIHANKYKTDKIIIGKNVWIGANSAILRGTIIGDNTVIGAGSVVKGSIPANSVLVQKRESDIIQIGENLENN